MRILLMIPLFLILGCFSQVPETPRDRFNAFLQALKTNNPEQTKNCFKPHSFERLLDSMERVGAKDWFSKMKKDTLESQPVFTREEWILRDQKVRVLYRHSSGEEDFLLMVFKDNRWWIQIPEMGNPGNTPLEALQVKKR